MSSIIGNNIKLSVFGESHGSLIGATLDGLPAGFEINLEEIESFLDRRKTGKKNTTKRKEDDKFKIVSGFFNGRTTGAPLTIIIENVDVKSNDYEKNKILPRPSHADYTSYIKYKGFADFRGGGHFSGRLTAPICVAGNIIMQILESKKIYIYSHIYKLNDIVDKRISEIDIEQQKKLKLKEIPFLDDENIDKANKKIQNLMCEGDSIGGQIETIIHNMKAGFGNPIFDNIESKIASAIFSVPGVKGIEFGNGFESSYLLGSENNDEFFVENNIIKTKTNNSGGINGGITNGMPIIFNVAIKPTSSILKKQNTVNLESMRNEIIEIKGRHDPSIVLRAVPVIEAITAISIYDILLEKNYEFDTN